jgi:hypothetical protein
MLALELARERQENHFDVAERRRLARGPRLAWWRWRKPSRSEVVDRSRVDGEELSQPAGTLTACIRAGAGRAALGSVR